MKIGEYDIHAPDGSPCGYNDCEELSDITVSGREFCKAHFAAQFLSGLSGSLRDQILVELLVEKLEADEAKRSPYKALSQGGFQRSVPK